MADLKVIQERTRGIVQTFLFKNFLADDPTDEITNDLDMFKLEFRDAGMEQRYTNALKRIAVQRNRQILTIAASFLVFYVIWNFLTATKDFRFWIVQACVASAFIVCIIGILTLLIKKEQFAIGSLYLIMIAVFVNTTFFWFLPDLIINSPKVIKNASDVNPIVYVQVYAGLAFSTSMFKHVQIVGFSFLIIHLAVFLAAEIGRLNGIVFMVLTYITLITTSMITAYRKEVYYRRIFWLQLKLNPGGTSADDFLSDRKVLNRNSSMYSGDGSKWSQFKQKMRVFLMISANVTTDKNFENFISQQSIGQTKISLTLQALLMVITVLVEMGYENFAVSSYDLYLRALVIPTLFLLYAPIRANSKKFKHGPLFAKIYITLLIIMIVVACFIMIIFSVTNPSVTDGSKYMLLFAQIAFSSCTIFGYRFRWLFPISFVTIVASVIINIKYKFTGNNIIISNGSAYSIACWFLAHYEKILRLYFDLKRKKGSKDQTMQAVLIEQSEVEKTVPLDLSDLGTMGLSKMKKEQDNDELGTLHLPKNDKTGALIKEELQ